MQYKEIAGRSAFDTDADNGSYQYVLSQSGQNRRSNGIFVYQYPVSYTHLDVYKRQVFVQFVDDYLRVMKAEMNREFSFMPDSRCDTPQEFTEELLKYGAENGRNIAIIKEGMSPRMMIDGAEYYAYRTSSRFGIVIHCKMAHKEDYIPEGMPESKYRKYRAVSLAVIPVPVSYTHLDVYKRQASEIPPM